VHQTFPTPRIRRTHRAPTPHPFTRANLTLLSHPALTIPAIFTCPAADCAKQCETVQTPAILPPHLHTPPRPCSRMFPFIPPALPGKNEPNFPSTLAPLAPWRPWRSRKAPQAPQNARFCPILPDSARPHTRQKKRTHQLPAKPLRLTRPPHRNISPPRVYVKGQPYAGAGKNQGASKRSV